MAEINIRVMIASDLDDVVCVEQAAFSTPWSRNAFAEELTNDLAHYLVVLEADKLVGYAGFWLVLDEAHVTNIALMPKCQGHGMGSLLLEHMIAQAKMLGAVSMTLEVRPSNTPARRLYARRGFVERGVRPNYYAELGEDALIMWLDKL